jgi:hypothetical protein
VLVYHPTRNDNITCRFAEDLVPFMDTHFDDPRAAKLAGLSMKKRQQQKVDLTSDMDAEDADLQAAIEKSMEQGVGSADGDLSVEEPKQQEQEQEGGIESPETVAANAAAALPPDESGPHTCRVGTML